MKIFLFIVLVMHGIIHLVGFIKAFDLIELSHLTKTISKPLGVLWLLTSILFFICMFALWMNYPWWWMLTLVTVILSQVIIVFDWNEAGFGTIANAIIFSGALVGFGQWSFDRETDHLVKGLIEQTQPNEELQSVETLPEPVKKWLTNSLDMNAIPGRTVVLKQAGKLRTSPEGRWMDFNAVQWTNPHQPGYVWRAGVDAFPGIHLSGLDSYLDGNGQMKISLMSLYPVVNATDQDIDRGSLIRYLAEIAWVPAAARQSFIHWEPIDDFSARATIHWGNMTESATFIFNENGDIREVRAMRPYQTSGGTSLEEWIIEVSPGAYRSFQGVRVPYSVEVIWNLDEGKFKWMKGELVDMYFTN